MTAFETRALFKQLEAAVEENLDRHLAAAEDWMPHEYVPWSEGRNFAALSGEPWSVEQSGLSAPARTAMEVNLLTEDNLPSYHRELGHTFGRHGAWGAWVNRWTAEEGRHASCIRDYLLVTRGVDPERLERARMATLQAGWDAGNKPLLHACAYVSFQELATRVSHRNTGRYCEDPIAERLLARIAMDENLHMIFYRNLVQAALEIAPSQTLRAIADEVAGFVMPGSVVPVLPARLCRSRRRASTTYASTTTMWSCRCCATGESSKLRAWTPKVNKHSRTSPRPSRRSTPGQPVSWSGGPRRRPNDPPASDMAVKWRRAPAATQAVPRSPRCRRRRASRTVNGRAASPWWRATGTSMRRVTSPDNVRRDLLELRPAPCMAGVALGGQVIVRKQSRAQGAGFVVFAGAWRPLR